MTSPLSTGCDQIDCVLRGGINREEITHIYGAPGGGKTTLAVNTAITALCRGIRVVYIDTERVAESRISQLAEHHPEDVTGALQRLSHWEPRDFQEQRAAVKKTEEVLSNNTELIVVDSLTEHYRVEQGDDDRAGDIHQELTNQLIHLLGLARRHDLAVVVTNQVYTDIDAPGNPLRPVGGNAVRNWPATSMSIETVTPGIHSATVEKHQSTGVDETVEFSITNAGITVTP